jgi:hypothetical protein
VEWPAGAAACSASTWCRGSARSHPA